MPAQNFGIDMRIFNGRFAPVLSGLRRPHVGRSPIFLVEASKNGNFLPINSPWASCPGLRRLFAEFFQFYPEKLRPAAQNLDFFPSGLSAGMYRYCQGSWRTPSGSGNPQGKSHFKRNFCWMLLPQGHLIHGILERSLEMKSRYLLVPRGDMEWE